MFSRVFVAVLVTLPMIASAAPTDKPAGQCNVGKLSCCNHTQAIPGQTSAIASGLLGIPLNLLPLIGLDCNPISVLGIGGNNCNAQPVCCQNNAFTGLINVLNCAPLNVNL